MTGPFFIIYNNNAMTNSDINQLIDKFEKFILERDLTLMQASILTKIHFTTISKILNREIKKPHKRTIYKIQKSMGIQ